MSSKSKIKGNKFERDCVKLAEEYDIPAVRAWGSDGRSLGYWLVKIEYDSNILTFRNVAVNEHLWQNPQEISNTGKFLL